MVSVSSLPTHGKLVFDLDSQSGVMHLLASIRASEIASNHKNELRDLVFLYTNGGKDLSVRLSLEQKIAAYNVTPAPQKNTSQNNVTEKKSLPVIGKFRSAPSFAVHVSTAAPVEVKVTPVAPLVHIPAPVQSIPVTVAPQPAVVPMREPVVMRVEQEPVPVPVAPRPAIAQPVIEVVAMPTPVPVSVAPAPTMGLDDQNYLQRIREIKALVNEKVGNPVNLVDINNEVGREYMGALLDAMKKINSGSSAGSAMKRLEDAYASVLTTLDNQSQVAPLAAAVAYKPEMRQEIHEDINAMESSETISEVVVEEAFVPVQVPHVQPVQPEMQPRTGRIPIQTAAPLESVSSWDAPQAVPISQPSHQEQVPQASFRPLSEAKEKPLSIDDLPTSASVNTASVARDELFTEEVDTGLNQLLQEWVIFRKSGMFGTGPKGKEHPLFLKMAPLHIPLLLAGRFEGATQEVKQSVTDYMNGWRYEQGLIYQQGETFEHYLRRVIRHILDLQKGA